jgi:hypothetical protein
MMMEDTQFLKCKLILDLDLALKIKNNGEPTGIALPYIVTIDKSECKSISNTKKLSRRRPFKET